MPRNKKAGARRILEPRISVIMAAVARGITHVRLVASRAPQGTIHSGIGESLDRHPVRLAENDRNTRRIQRIRQGLGHL